MSDTLSIIIPVYNCSKYIERCVESIIKNIGAEIHLQIILVNDGSTDDSDNKCTKLAEKHSVIQYIRQNNKGASSARNAGLKLAEGEFIWFVDADDSLHQSAKKILPYLDKDNQYDIITFNYAEETFSGLIPKNQFETKQILSTTSYLEKNRKLYLWNKIFRRNTIGDIRFLEGTKNIEDFLFNIEVLNKTNNICCIPEYGYVYNTCNQNSTSRSLSKRNLIKLSLDSFEIHKHLYTLIKESQKNKRIIQKLLSFSIAGHFYSLIRFYNLKRVKKAIEEYDKAGLYPIKFTDDTKANLLLFLINSSVFRALLRLMV